MRGFAGRARTIAVGRVLSLFVSVALVVGAAAGAAGHLPRPGWHDVDCASEQAWRRNGRTDLRAVRELAMTSALPPVILPPAPAALVPALPSGVFDRPQAVFATGACWTPLRCPRGPPPWPLS
jgi:hypothetical protein